MMTVKELIKELLDYDLESRVYVDKNGLRMIDNGELRLSLPIERLK